MKGLIMVNKQIEICNGALLLLGANRISSLVEESAESIACNQFYERTYRSLISIYGWKFCMKIKELAILTGVTPGDPHYQYAYQLPTDLVWLQHILPNRQNYKVMGDQLHSPYKPLSIKYSYRAKEELMPALFEQTLMYYLASEMSLAITEDSNKSQVLYLQYMDHLKRAKAVDAQQQPQDEFADFPIDAARYGY